MSKVIHVVQKKKQEKSFNEEQRAVIAQFWSYTKNTTVDHTLKIQQLIIHWKYSRKSGRYDEAPYLSPREETGHSVALVYHNAGGIDLARAATAVTGGALHGGRNVEAALNIVHIHITYILSLSLSLSLSLFDIR